MSSRYIRIFISSTFSDFTEERDALNKDVFPKLKAYCRQRGFTFQTVDLRWGVTQEASTEQDTIRICLEEVERCQKLSPTPNFFLLLGDRYGWEPLPPHITETTANQIFPQLKEMPRERDKNILPPFELFEKWYVLDSNHVPPHYILRSRTEGDNFKVESDFLLGMLRHAAAESSLSKEELDKFFLSATAFEILEGIKDVLHPTHQNSPVICYFRKIDNIARHVDIDNDKKTRLSALKDELRNTYPEFEFEVTLGKKSITHSYISRFKKATFQTLKKVIDFRIREEKAKKAASPAMIERHIHEQFATLRRENFFGRHNELIQLQKYIDSPEKKALVVYGEGGVGKSAFMAENIRKVLEHKIPLCFFRFIGASASSTNAYSLVRSLCEEIYHVVKKSVTKSIGKKKSLPKNYPALCGFFENLLNNIPKTEKVVIFVDAIDQLQSEYGERALRWIPTQLPENVAFIVSTQGGEHLQNALASFLAPPQTLLIPHLDFENVQSALHQLLEKNSRKLQPNQEKLALERSTQSGLGLYLNMAFQLVKNWKSYDEDYDLPEGINELIQYVYTDLATERHHGKVLTERVLGYLALAYQGMTEDEIMQILTDDATVMSDFERRFPRSPKIGVLPFIVWARVRSSINDYLKEVSINEFIHLQFYHRLLEENVTRTFLSSDFMYSLHEKLCDFFIHQDTWFDTKKQLPNMRKITALPYHLREVNDVGRLKQLIIDKDYFHAKIETNNLYSYAKETLWVNKNIESEEEQCGLAKTIFSLVINHNAHKNKVKIDWSDLHSLLIYTKNRLFHRQFFSVPKNVDDILKFSHKISKESAQEIYQICLANKVNYYRRMGLLDIGEKLVLEELSKHLPVVEKYNASDAYKHITHLNEILSIEEVKNIETETYTNSDKTSSLLQGIGHLPYYSRLLYELGFIQFFQGKFDVAFDTMLASSVSARQVQNSSGELIPRCVAYHIQAINHLFDTENKKIFMDKYKAVLLNAREEFARLAVTLKKGSDKTNAERWRDANTIEHEGIIAANMDDLDTLRSCEQRYSNSSWVKGNDDKSNLYLMQARLAELEARHASPQNEELYKIACEKMEYFIQYEEKRVANSGAKIDYEAQLYLCLGRSYKCLGNIEKAKEAWNKAIQLDNEPGNHTWKKEAEYQLSLL